VIGENERMPAVQVAETLVGLGSLFVTVLFTHPSIQRIESHKRSSQIGHGLGTRALETWRQTRPGFRTAITIHG
jgi:hypothetical protein